MILLLMPALMTWFLIRRMGRRWQRGAILVFAPIPIALTAEVYAWLSVDQLPPMFIYAYAVVTLGIGAMLVFAPPRKRPYQCHCCGYDLRGIEQRNTCPECGGETPFGRMRAAAEVRAKRRAVQTEHANAVRAARERLARERRDQEPAA